VAHIERLGAETYVHLALSQRRSLVLRRDGSLDIGEGASLRLSPVWEGAYHLFAADGSALPAAPSAMHPSRSPRKETTQ